MNNQKKVVDVCLSCQYLYCLIDIVYNGQGRVGHPSVAPQHTYMIPILAHLCLYCPHMLEGVFRMQILCRKRFLGTISRVLVQHTPKSWFIWGLHLFNLGVSSNICFKRRSIKFGECVHSQSWLGLSVLLGGIFRLLDRHNYVHGAEDAGCPHPRIRLNKAYVLVDICSIRYWSGAWHKLSL